MFPLGRASAPGVRAALASGVRITGLRRGPTPCQPHGWSLQFPKNSLRKSRNISGGVTANAPYAKGLPSAVLFGCTFGGVALCHEECTKGKVLTESERKEIENLVQNATVFVVMKGTRGAPRCKYSTRMVTILEESGFNFEYADILGEHSHLREAFKSYANWPTIPMLFVRGEFVGGVDIIEELVENGELTACEIYA